MIFSTSSPTYPASVSVVASAIVKGTRSIFASVWASRVLPQNEHRRVPLPSRVRAIRSLLLGRQHERFADRARRRLGRDDFVDDSIVLRLLGGHEKVAIGVTLDLVHALAGVVHEDAVQLLAHPEDLAGLDVDVGRLALHAAQRLVDHDP